MSMCVRVRARARACLQLRIVPLPAHTGARRRGARGAAVGHVGSRDHALLHGLGRDAVPRPLVSQARPVAACRTPRTRRGARHPCSSTRRDAMRFHSTPPHCAVIDRHGSHAPPSACQRGWSRPQAGRADTLTCRNVLHGAGRRLPELIRNIREAEFVPPPQVPPWAVGARWLCLKRGRSRRVWRYAAGHRHRV